MIGFLQQLFNLKNQDLKYQPGGFLFKGKCPCCQRASAAPLCPACEKQFRAEPLPDFSQFQDYALPIFAAGLYQGQLKRLIRTLKYDHQAQLGPFLGEWLAQTWYHNQSKLVWPQPLPKNLVVVPIPLHSSKEQQRGYNQAELIAQGFCRVTHLPLLARGLIRQQQTTPQFGLTAQQRQQNLTNVFQLGQQLQHQLQKGYSPQPAVLLLDDILTTGATIYSSQTTLQKSGVEVLGVVAVAITPKREGAN